MKKGQLMAQPFIFIFAIIVGALILIFGIYQIFNITNTACVATLAQEKIRFENKIDQKYFEPSGSSEAYNFDVDAEYVCFADINKPKTQSNQEVLELASNINILSQKYNLLFVPTTLCRTERAFFEIEYLSIPEDSENPLCIPINENFKLTAKGQTVEVSKIEQ